MSPHTTTTTHTVVRVPSAGVHLTGDLALPAGSGQGLVLFAHGSGSSRHSPRNQFVARVLEEHGLGTLLIDLLTFDEEAVDVVTTHLRFDIDLLARRLVGVIDWLRASPATAHHPLGLFGASTGGGAALLAATLRPRDVGAVVSRGGRPDLAGPALAHVTAPTLLIVGGRDTPVIDLNRKAMAGMRGEVALEIVPGATHLFEEPGTLARVAELAAEFFARRLPGSGETARRTA